MKKNCDTCDDFVVISSNEYLNVLHFDDKKLIETQKNVEQSFQHLDFLFNNSIPETRTFLMVRKEEIIRLPHAISIYIG